jgi:hypothetical protein
MTKCGMTTIHAGPTSATGDAHEFLKHLEDARHHIGRSTGIVAQWRSYAQLYENSLHLFIHTLQPTTLYNVGLKLRECELLDLDSAYK